MNTIEQAARPTAESAMTILGVDVAAATYERTIDRLLRAVADREPMRVHFCTVHTLVEATSDEQLRRVMNTAELVAPDGMPLVWVGRLRGYRVERSCGPDVMRELFDRGRAPGLRHFLYGGAPGVAERLATRLSADYPGAQIVGTHSPPFRPLTEEEDAEVVRMLEASGADCIWVGLGSPRQEFWLAAHRDRLTAPLLLAVGAAFDFHSGTKRRAPRIMQRTGTEWLFRLASEPRRLLGRYVRTNSRFVWLLAVDGASSLRRRFAARSGDGG